MNRRSLVALMGTLVLVANVSAGAPRWQWKPGQTLIYRVEQNTTVLDRVEETSVETKSSLVLRKRWKVLEVDGSGVATLSLTLDAITMQTTAPDGEMIRFDSVNPEQSTPALRDQVGQYVGKVLAVIRVGSQGQVVEVKESHFGPATRYQNELPFAIVLPTAERAAGETWERAYEITVVEKTPAKQHYTCKSADEASFVTTLTTEMSAPPAAPADWIPWLQYLPQGEAVFDVKNGRLQSAHLKISKEVKGHQGENSAYRLESVYAEQLVEAK